MAKTFTDNRGTIKDIIVNDEYAITSVTFNTGAVRGNHYHEHTTQIDIVASGKLLVRFKEGKIVQETILSKGDVITHNPLVPHAYKALESSELICTCFGVRKGEDYEKDTIRLETPLI